MTGFLTEAESLWGKKNSIVKIGLQCNVYVVHRRLNNTNDNIGWHMRMYQKLNYKTSLSFVERGEGGRG